MTQQYPITLAEFRAWLETKRPTARVGTRHRVASCPIARYAKARGDERPWVTGRWISLGPDTHYVLPEWAQAFLNAVDAGPSLSGVQARTALRLLDRVAHASLPEDEQDHERTALESEALRDLLGPTGGEA